MIFFLFITINAITFLIFGYDKWLAKNNKHRISEKNLLIISLIGGIFGGTIAMLLFNHKVSKGSFLWKFIMVILLQITLIYLLISNNYIDFQNIMK